MFLVVLEHVLRCYSESDMPLMNGAFQASFIHAISFFHMPAFFLLAGFCLGMSKKNVTGLQSYFAFEWDKVQRLMIPYFILCVVQLAAALAANKRTLDMVPSEMLNAFTIPLHGPASHGWFLIVLMLIFILWPLLRILTGNSVVAIFVAVTLLELVKNHLPSAFNSYYMETDRLIRYLPLFALGFMMARINGSNLLIWKPAAALMLLAGVSICAALCITLKTTDFLMNLPIRGIIYSIASLAGNFCGGVLIVKISVKAAQMTTIISRTLSHIGRYSYDIYLYHLLIAIGAVLVIGKLDISNNLILATSPFTYAASIFFAYLGCRIIRKNRLLTRFVLGDITT